MTSVQISPDHALLMWLATETVTVDQWPKLLGMLDDAERARADRFRFARDRDAYVASHALTRGTLTRLTGRPPSSWTFETGSHGKPEVVCCPGTPRIRINSAHTHGLAAVALILDHDIGCDAEFMSSDAPPRIADRFFAPAELTGLYAMHGSAARERFYALWTLKEAYLKAVGRGLGLGLDAAVFHFDPLTVTFSAQVDDRPEAWHFDLYSLSPEHVVALAVRHPAPAALAVTADAVDPGQLIAAAGDW